MTRAEKIKALLAIKAGTPAGRVLPIHELFLVGSEDNIKVMMGGPGIILKEEQVADFIKQIKAKHPDKYVEVMRLSWEKFNQYSAQLEEKY